MTRLPLTLIFSALFTAIAGAAAPWDFAKPEVPFSPTPAVSYGAGRWVGVGPKGKIITSTNGIAWTPGPLLTGEDLLDITFAAGRFVACGGEGTILTSPNGLQWEHRTSGEKAELRDVCHGGGMWVFSGKHSSYQHPVILSSSDLAIWNRFDTAGKYKTGGTTAEGYTVVFGNGQFLMPMPNSQAFVSSDGIGWTKQTNNLNFSAPQCSIYDSGKFYCLNHWDQFSSSPDGITWTAMESPADFRERTFSLHVEGSRMIISSEYGFYTSSDGGAIWTKREVYSYGLSESRCGGIGKGDGVYLVMAYDGSAIRSTNFSWQAEYIGPDKDHFTDVCHGNGTFVAVGYHNDNDSQGVIWSSPDGKAWTKRRNEGRNLYAVCYGNGTWVGVGEASGWSEAVIVTSSNLKTWTERSNPAPYALRDVIFANGLFVAVGGDYGQAVLMTSPDGMTWTARESGAPGRLLKVAHANGVFVAIGARGTDNQAGISSSPDGIHWTPCALELAHTFNCLAYGNSMFLAASANGEVMKSINGVDWTVLKPIASSSSYHGLTDLVHDGTRFVACAGSSARPPAYSVDGREWSHDLTGAALSAMVAAEGKIVAVGVNHHIASRPIAAVPDGPGSVSAKGPTVFWSPVAGAAGYQIYKRLPGEKSWVDAALTQPAGATSALLDGLTESSTYEISVQAVTANGLSRPAFTSVTTFGHLDMWMLANFRTRENSGTAADTADPDGDGRVNLLEYALGSDPSVFEHNYGPLHSATLYKTNNGGRVVQFSFSFPLDRRKTDTTCYVESSTDLVTWARVAESIGGGTMTVLDAASGWGVNDAHLPGNISPIRGVMAGKKVGLPVAEGQGKLYARFGVERIQP